MPQTVLPRLSSYLPKAVDGPDSNYLFNTSIHQFERDNCRGLDSLECQIRSSLQKRAQEETAPSSDTENEAPIRPLRKIKFLEKERQPISSTQLSVTRDHPDTERSPGSKTTGIIIGDIIQPTSSRRGRNSRYLREFERRVIIARIASGEKQCALADEFNVSRAAISNLYKKRREVLSRMTVDPTSTHPRKARSSQPRQAPLQPADIYTTDSGGYPACVPRQSLDGPPRTQGRSAIRENYQFRFYEVSAHSFPCKKLIASFGDPTASMTVLRQRVTRLTRLLIEEALACLPLEQVKTQDEYGNAHYRAKGLDEGKICAIGIEKTSAALIKSFSNISPESPTGILSAIQLTEDKDISSNPNQAQLPTVLPHQVLMLLGIHCTTGTDVCTILNYLVYGKRISAENIYFVSVVSCLKGLENVFRHFPDVKLITAKVDTMQNEQTQSWV